MFNKTSFKFAAGFAGLIVLGIIIWFGAAYLSPEARQERETLQYFEDLEEAYKTDTYGGETPEETLELFIVALEAEDIELASKYFVPDRQAEWEGKLTNFKNDGLISEFVNRVKQLDSKYPLVEGEEDNYIFESYNKDGELVLQANVALIASGVWKIVDM